MDHLQFNARSDMQRYNSHCLQDLCDGGGCSGKASIARVPGTATTGAERLRSHQTCRREQQGTEHCTWCSPVAEGQAATSHECKWPRQVHTALLQQPLLLHSGSLEITWAAAGGAGCAFQRSGSAHLVNGKCCSAVPLKQLLQFEESLGLLLAEGHSRHGNRGRFPVCWGGALRPTGRLLGCLRCVVDREGDPLQAAPSLWVPASGAAGISKDAWLLTRGVRGEGCTQAHALPSTGHPAGSDCRGRSLSAHAWWPCPHNMAQHWQLLLRRHGCSQQPAASKLPHAGGCSHQHCMQEPACAASTASICPTHWGVPALGDSAATAPQPPHLVTIHHLDDHALPQVGVQDDSLAALLPHDHPRPACRTQQPAVSALPACPAT